MRLFEIVKEDVFCQKADRIAIGIHRDFELQLSLDLALTRNPIRFSHNISGKYYIWVTKPLPFNIPPLKILFHLDQEKERVVLIDIAPKNN